MRNEMRKIRDNFNERKVQNRNDVASSSLSDPTTKCLLKKTHRYETKVVDCFYKYLKMFSTYLIFCIIVDMATVSSQSLVSKSRKTAFIPGDILIGALVSVHHQPLQKSASSLECGHIREQYGIQRVEAAFLAVDRINKDDKILPNITLGIEIRDSCWYASIALEQSIEFIRDAITGRDGTEENMEKINYFCPKVTNPGRKNLVGVIGPGSSAVTIQVQNLLQLFRIPQVGYSATSIDLSDKNRFSYFQRVVPSDYYQAQVMVDIVKRFHWTYVSAVHTEGNYGQSGITAFRELADKSNICIAKEDAVRGNAEDEAFDEVIRQLSEDSRANVVVCFCEGMTIRNLLMAVKRLNKVHRFLFLGSDGWADRSDVVVGYEHAFVGGISVKIQSSYVESFDDHYFALHPERNDRNPWFKQFWEYRFNCTFSTSEDTSLPDFSLANDTTADGRFCTGNEKLSEGYKQDTKMSFVQKAIYTMAYGLHNIHKDLCGGEPGLCKAMLPVNGSLFRDYLLNVTFPYLNERISFDSKGDLPGRYDIMNYQQLINGSYDYVKVGTWFDGRLRMNESLMVFNGSDKFPPTSVCSSPCAPGQVKSFISTGENTQKCCWICNDCAEIEYLQNETTCSPCDQDHWPNLDKTGCDPIDVEYMDWDHDGSIAAMVIAAIGFLTTCFTMAVFLKYNHTPIVKASTRELTYIIFVGMMVSYLSSLPLLHMPTKTSCSFARILPGLSFSMIYSALVTKTNRIARILAGNKKIRIRKLKFMSATAQVVITCIFISVEAVIIICMLFYEPPEAIRSYPSIGKVVIICNTTALGAIVPMGWVFILVILCTIYAVKTRNLPENFNEAKFIGFAVYTNCVIWMAWVPIYFGSDHKIISMSVCTSLSAFVTLGILFLPKLYIMLCRPEKNDRAAFKTATNVRCHIGSTPKQCKITQGKASQSPSSIGGGASSFQSSADNKWSEILVKMKGAIHQSGTARGAVLTSTRGDHQPSTKILLKRETSVWSDVSLSQASSVAQHRDLMLQRAYGSQLDLDHEGTGRWSLEEKSCQTSDELLDPLIPRMRRRVARAVREGTLTTAEGREFFSLTHGWMQEQADAAKIEYQKMQEVKAAEEAAIKAEEEKQEEADRLKRASSKHRKNPWGTVRSEVEKLKGLKQNQSLLTKLKGKGSTKAYKDETKGELGALCPQSSSQDSSTTKRKSLTEKTEKKPPIQESHRVIHNPEIDKSNSIAVPTIVSPTTTSINASISSNSFDRANVMFEIDNNSGHRTSLDLIPVEVTVTRFNVTNDADIQKEKLTNPSDSRQYCSPFVDLKPKYIYPNNSNKNIISIMDSRPCDIEEDDKQKLLTEKSVAEILEDDLENISDQCRSSIKENELIILELLRKRSLMKAITLSSDPTLVENSTTRKASSEPRQNHTADGTGSAKSKHKNHRLRRSLRKRSNGMSKSQTMQHIRDDENFVRVTFSQQPKSLSDSNLSRCDRIDPERNAFLLDKNKLSILRGDSKSSRDSSVINQRPLIQTNSNLDTSPPIQTESDLRQSPIQTRSDDRQSPLQTLSDDRQAPIKTNSGFHQSPTIVICDQESLESFKVTIESECETDDSCNIEKFFTDRGLNFDRTSKTAKKL